MEAAIKSCSLDGLSAALCMCGFGLDAETREGMKGERRPRKKSTRPRPSVLPAKAQASWGHKDEDCG